MTFVIKKRIEKFVLEITSLSNIVLMTYNLMQVHSVWSVDPNTQMELKASGLSLYKLTFIKVR